jgi:hypothetical protein
MVFEILLTMSLHNAIMNKSCPAVELRGWEDGESMTEVDLKNLRIAQKRCPRLYKNSPCLRIFMKLGFQDYRALCGGLE